MGGITSNWRPTRRPDLPIACRKTVAGDEPQPDVFETTRSGRLGARSSAVPGPARMRNENPPGKRNRIRPTVARARECLDNAALHAPRRPGAGGGAGSGRVADGHFSHDRTLISTARLKWRRKSKVSRFRNYSEARTAMPHSPEQLHPAFRRRALSICKAASCMNDRRTNAPRGGDNQNCQCNLSACATHAVIVTAARPEGEDPFPACSAAGAGIE